MSPIDKHVQQFDDLDFDLDLSDPHYNVTSLARYKNRSIVIFVSSSIKNIRTGVLLNRRYEVLVWRRYFGITITITITMRYLYSAPYRIGQRR